MTDRWRKLPHHKAPEDNVLIVECLRLWDRGLDTKGISLIVFQPEHIVETATRIGRERRRQMEEDDVIWNAKEKSKPQ